MPISSVELSVVLPALDESENLQVLLPKLIETLKALGASYEIIVVDGGSDGTAAVVEASGVRLLRQAGKGYGSALHEGLQAAGGRWILTMDADGSHPPEAVARLWALRQSGELVAASRFCAGGSAQMPGWRYWISRLLNLGTGLLLGLPLEDASSGYRLYDAKTVKGLAPVARDFSAQQEIVAGVMRGGGRVLEIPFHYSPRGRGVSKARMSWAFSYLRTFARVLGILHGRAAVPALLAAVSLAGAAGLWGLRWGVPDRGRLRVLPARLQPTPEVARRFADQWRKLYEEIGRAHDEMKPEEPVTYVEGVEIVEPGWDFPPPKLANSYRSFLLQSEHPDEKKAFIILAQMRPWKLDLKPLYLQYGGSFVYPLGAFLKAGAVLGLLTLDPDPAYYMAHPQAMGRLYVAARLFILFFHLGAVGLIVLLGLRLSGWRAGLCAAALYCLSPVVIENAHMVKPHAYAVFWVAASALGMFAAAETGAAARFIICGAAAGLAAGANVALAPYLGLPLAAALLRRGGWRAGVLGCAAGVAAFAAFNPYLLLTPRAYAWELLIYGAPALAITPAALGKLARSAWGLFGPGSCLLLAAGVAAGLWRGGRLRALAWVVVLSFLAFWLRLAHLNDVAALRLYLPVLALAAVLAGEAACSNPLPRGVKAAVLAAAFADAGFRGAAVLSRFSLDGGPGSTRARAADWIDAHIPEGDSVGLVRYPAPSSTPPFRFDRYRLVLFRGGQPPAPAQRPGWIVVDAAGRREIDNGFQNGYDEVAAFTTPGAGWVRPDDEASFADKAMYVFRRRAAR